MEQTLPHAAVPYSPVHLAVARPDRFTRMQLLVRGAVFIALGMVGLSFAGIFGFAYLVLPIYAAVRLGSPESARSYLDEDRPRILGFLRWFASLSAWSESHASEAGGAGLAIGFLVAIAALLVLPLGPGRRAADA